MARAGAHLVVDDVFLGGDRVPGMAERQADVVHRGVRYDLEIDTTDTGSLDCARTIAAHLRSSRGDRAD
jgi:chloramphenicol 3-O phosphotransferase